MYLQKKLLKNNLYFNCAPATLNYSLNQPTLPVSVSVSLFPNTE